VLDFLGRFFVKDYDIGVGLWYFVIFVCDSKWSFSRRDSDLRFIHRCIWWYFFSFLSVPLFAVGFLQDWAGCCICILLNVAVTVFYLQLLGSGLDVRLVALGTVYRFLGGRCWRSLYLLSFVAPVFPFSRLLGFDIYWLV